MARFDHLAMAQTVAKHGINHDAAQTHALISIAGWGRVVSSPARGDDATTAILAGLLAPHHVAAMVEIDAARNYLLTAVPPSARDAAVAEARKRSLERGLTLARAMRELALEAVNGEWPDEEL